MKIKEGDTAKAEKWSWGGTVTAVNQTAAFIRVGSEETGEIYEVPLSDCRKFCPETGNFIPVVS